MDSCIFCKIVDGKIPSTTIFEDDNVKVILDIAPAAKVNKYGNPGLIILANKIVITAPIGSTTPVNTPSPKDFGLDTPFVFKDTATIAPSGKF